MKRQVDGAALSISGSVSGHDSDLEAALALQDPDPLIRIEAVEALEELGGESAVWVLNHAAADQDPEVKFAINETLTALEGQP